MPDVCLVSKVPSTTPLFPLSFPSICPFFSLYRLYSFFSPYFSSFHSVLLVTFLYFFFSYDFLSLSLSSVHSLSLFQPLRLAFNLKSTVLKSSKGGQSTPLKFVLNSMILSFSFFWECLASSILYSPLFYFTFSNTHYSSYKSENFHKGLGKYAF